MQALPAAPESLCIVEMGGGGNGDERGLISAGGLFLNIGLQNGVLLRTAIDSVTGDLSDTRTRFVPTYRVYVFVLLLASVSFKFPYFTIFIAVILVLVQ